MQTVDFDGVGTWSGALTIAKTSWCTPDYNWHRGIEYIRSHPQFLNFMKVSIIVANNIKVQSAVTTTTNYCSLTIGPNQLVPLAPVSDYRGR